MVDNTGYIPKYKTKFKRKLSFSIPASLPAVLFSEKYIFVSGKQTCSFSSLVKLLRSVRTGFQMGIEKKVMSILEIFTA